jgi:hypothetical protein
MALKRPQWIPVSCIPQFDEAILGAAAISGAKVRRDYLFRNKAIGIEIYL